MLGIHRHIHTPDEVFIFFSPYLGGEVTIPTPFFELQPRDAGRRVEVTIVDDTLAEDTESLSLLLRATVSSTPISQEFETQITIQDNEGEIWCSVDLSVDLQLLNVDIPSGRLLRENMYI